MKKGKVGNNSKRRNVTAHDRAMTHPEVQKTFRALRSNWNQLSQQQRGEQLQKLVDSGCSIRGVARDLVEPEANIRRYIASANPDEGSDWTVRLERTLAKGPEKVRARRAVLPMPPKDSCHRRSVERHPEVPHTGSCTVLRDSAAKEDHFLIIDKGQGASTCESVDDRARR